LALKSSRKYVHCQGKVVLNLCTSFFREPSIYDQPFYERACLVGILAGELNRTGKLGAL